MRKVDWIAVLLVLVVAIAGRIVGVGDIVPETQNPRRPHPELFAPQAWDAETRAWLAQGPLGSRNQIPQGAPLPQRVTVGGTGAAISSTGSAASVSANGTWLTARHVVEGCHQTLIQTGEKTAYPALRAVIHPNADVALVITDASPKGIPVAAQVGAKSDAFTIGFPQGRPGAVHGQFLGETTVIYRRGGFRERVDAWSKVSEIPTRWSSLGGLSGGAVLDNSGRIIGVIQSESDRRGRFMTARSQTVRSMFELAGIEIPFAEVPASAPGVTPESYPAVARALITSLRVAKVHCRVD